MKQIHFLAMSICMISTVVASGQDPNGQIQQTGAFSHGRPGPVKQRLHQVGDYVADEYAANHVNAVTYSGHSYQGGAGG